MRSTSTGSPTKPRSSTRSILESGSLTVLWAFFGEDHVAVLAAQADRPFALGIDQRHDLLVDGTSQHHLDDLDGLFVGDAQAAFEARFDAHLLEHRRDLWSATMHDDGIDADCIQQRDVAGEGPAERGIRPWHGRHNLPTDGLVSRNAA